MILLEIQILKTKFRAICFCCLYSIYFFDQNIFGVSDGKESGFPGGSDSKESAAMQETWVRYLGGEDPLEKEMASHSSILTWKIPWTEEPDRLQSVRLQRVRHDSHTI